MVSEEGSVTEDADKWIDGTEEVQEDECALFGPSDDEDITMREQRDTTTEPLIAKPDGDHREPRDLQSPIKPSARAVELHSYTHIPYRSWCKVCKAARCREDAHRRRKADDEDEAIEGNAMPIISLSPPVCILTASCRFAYFAPASIRDVRIGV